LKKFSQPIIYLDSSKAKQKKQTISGDDNGGTIDNIRKTVHIYPALSEVVSSAAADIHGI
jgi:hypothetical protein